MISPVAAGLSRGIGHPRGLWVLVGTELWERISFHGMQAMLTLYLADQLLLSGHVEHVFGLGTLRVALEGKAGPVANDVFAARIFGLYIGLIYLMPVVGGLVGDRLTGRRVAIMAGALLMAGGHFAVADDRTILLGLLLLILGTGLLRGNLPAQVKTLYPAGDRREADAFQIYYVAICMGAFLSPLFNGALAAASGWHVASRLAGMCMIVGLIIYLTGQKHLPPDKRRAVAASRSRLTSSECRRLLGLLAIWPLVVCFWVAQVQVWNVYNLWVRDHVQLGIAGYNVPVPWLQSLDGLAPALLSPCVVLWWRRQALRAREPDLFSKLATGCLIFAAALGLLALAPLFENGVGRAPLLLPVLFHLISNLGAVYIVPVALTLFAVEAPPALRGAMIGVNSLAVFMASLISGHMGELYAATTPSRFWLIHAVLLAGAGGSFWLLRRPLAPLFMQAQPFANRH